MTTTQQHHSRAPIGVLRTDDGADWPTYVPRTAADAKRLAREQNERARLRREREDAEHASRLAVIAQQTAAAKAHRLTSAPSLRRATPRATTPASTAFGPSAFWKAHRAREAGAR